MFGKNPQSSWFARAQNFGKSFMLPIAVLPAAGLLLGIGGAFSNPNTIKAYPFLDIDYLQNLFVIMSDAGSVVFANLALLFAVGIAAVLSLLIMNTVINSMLKITDTLATDNLADAGQGISLGIQTFRSTARQR